MTPFDLLLEINGEHVESFQPYEKQLSFIEATQHCDVSYLSAGNGCGKTAIGAYIDVCHWTGRYPDWWDGQRFDTPGDYWVLSVEPKILIKAIQTQLFCKGGFSKVKAALEDASKPWPIDANRGGKMPKRFIKSITRASNYSEDFAYVENMEVHHVSGGVSTVWFGHYKNSPSSFVGTHNLRFVHFDEMPPQAIYSECLARQRTTDEGYNMIITATPDRMVCQLMTKDVFSNEWEQNGNSRAIITIDDVPDNIISAEAKDKAKRLTPERDKPAKLYGMPVQGAVFFSSNPSDFRISHSEWLNLKSKNVYRVVNGLDFGFNDDEAISQLYIATDGHMVLAKSMKKQRLKPYQFAEAAKKSKFDIDHYPCGWPHDGMRADKDMTQRRVGADTLKTVAQFHKDAGFKMLPHHNKKFAKESEKHVIFEHLETLAEQRMFFVVAGNSDFEEEWRSLQVGDDNKVKGKDHILDSVVAAYMARGSAVKPKDKTILMANSPINYGISQQNNQTSSHLYT